MKIELKNFKYAEFASEETLCFTASVYVDGTRMFTASNSGKGEENRIEPVKGKSREDVRQVQDWVANQPKVKLEDDMEIDDKLDFYISRLAEREIARKKLKSLLSKHVVIFKPNTPHSSFVQFDKSFKPTDLSDSHREHLQGIYHDCLIINDIDIEKALDLYLATAPGSPIKADDVYQQIKAA